MKQVGFYSQMLKKAFDNKEQADKAEKEYIKKSLKTFGKVK